MHNPRPPSCRGCAFDNYSAGFVPPYGPDRAPLLFIGEAPAKREIALSQPFVGESGAVLNRIFHFLSTSREFMRLANVVGCMTPDAEWHRSLHAPSAIAHCHDAHLRHVLAEPHKVVVTLGAVPTKQILGLEGQENFSIKDFHGTVQRDPTDRYWVVPTFHPAHILRGAWSLLGTMIYDITQAMDIARAGDSWRPAPPPVLTVDPPPDWWSAWVDAFIENTRHNPGAFWLSVDTETPRKTKRGDEGELKGDDRGEVMTRLNAACGAAEGISVTNHPCYRDASTRLMACLNPKMLWNGPFDTEVLVNNRMPMAGPILDFMWGWHVLQSDVPRGLGFAAPNYLPWRSPWKHLSGSDPGTYAAWDGVNNWVIGSGITADLMRLNMWPVFYDHIYRADQQIFFPATRMGLLVDRPALKIYAGEVKASLAELIVHMRDPALVPESIRNLHPPGGWKKDPGVGEKAEPDWDEKEDGPAPMHPVFAQQIPGAIVNVCTACGAEQIQKRHRCKDKELTPFVIADERTVTRWYIRKPFNPGSAPQLLSLIGALGYKAPISKKTKKPTTEKLGIEELARKTKEPAHKDYFNKLLLWKEAKKVQGNYVNGTIRRLETDPRSKLDGRLHGETTHSPSTLRTSMRNPNLQNVTIHGSLSAGFRKCLVAAPGHKLIGADYSGIEALLVGWFARDPIYMRLARLGVHAYLASHVLGQPADLRASDKELKDFLKQFKEKEYEEPYDRCKRVVHGTNYGLTPYGMAERFPKFFPSRVIAEKIQQLYYKLCPKLRSWQQELKRLADKYHYLGGPGGHSPHPFGYKHWFYNVREFRPITAAQAKYLEVHDREWAKLGDNYYKIVPGDDAKRVLAFPPQSTARGVAVEAGLRLTDPACENTLVGFGNDGDTPFRALVHDEWLLEVPDEKVQEAATRLVREMCRPVRALPLDKSWWTGPEEYLSIGVEVFIGQNWDKKSGMEKMDIKGIEIPEVWELVKDLDDLKRSEEAEQEQDPEEDGYEESAQENAVRRALAG